MVAQLNKLFSYLLRRERDDASSHMTSTPSEQLRRTLEQAERAVVRRFSRGSARLQQGKYLTQADIDARLKRIRDRADRYGD